MVLKGYPRLSETFIAQELLHLERRGARLMIVSLRHPTDRERHPIHAEIRAPLHYLPEYLHQEPLRVLRALVGAYRQPGIRACLAHWWRDFRRDPRRSRLRRLGQALVLARELPESIVHLYAHFIHTPASVARYAALLSRRPWSASAHAKDIWTLPTWELREKLAELSWLVTCTAANRDYLQSLSPDPTRVRLVYHGLDFRRFPLSDRPATAAAEGHNRPVALISVGRAVPKKGYDLLLEALARLPRNLRWHFTHIGGGEQLAMLQALAERLGIAERIRWRGALPQTQVLAAYQEADLFVLASRILENGDRDGLPNVLMEAQSQRLCCLATDISGIPELIASGTTGLLVPQGDVEALRQALVRLITEPQWRRQLAEAGYQRVREDFDVRRGIDALAQYLPLESLPLESLPLESLPLDPP